MHENGGLTRREIMLVGSTVWRGWELDLPATETAPDASADAEAELDLRVAGALRLAVSGRVN